MRGRQTTAARHARKQCANWLSRRLRGHRPGDEAKKQVRKPSNWLASKSISFLIHRHPMRNDSSGNGGYSKGPRSSGKCVIKSDLRGAKINAPSYLFITGP